MKLVASLATFSFALVFTAPVSAQTLGYWRFEEGAADAVATGAASVLDSSAFANHGTPANGPVYRASVPAAVVPATGSPDTRSLEFDGADDRVFVPGTFPLHTPGDATVEFFFRYANVGHRSVLWTRTDNTDSDRFNIFVNGNGTFGFDYRSPSGALHLLVGSVANGIPIPPMTWTHIAITRQGNLYRLYVNGTLDGTALDVNPDLPTGTGWCRSGRDGYIFQGNLDEVRCSQGALTPGQFLVKTFNDLGYGLAGTHGIPQLGGTGTLLPGDPVTLTLGGARENTTAYFVLGTSAIYAPQKGGIFVPYPTLVMPLPTGTNGALVINSTWPAGVPSGFTMYLQYWIVDPIGIAGYAASNAVSATSP